MCEGVSRTVLGQLRMAHPCSDVRYRWPLCRSPANSKGHSVVYDVLRGVFVFVDAHAVS